MGQYGLVLSDGRCLGESGRLRARLVLLGGAALALGWPSSARAQVVTDTPDAGPTSDARSTAAARPPTATPAETPPPAAAPPLAAAVGVRSLLVVQNPAARDELDDIGATGEAQVVLAGQVHRFLNWQAGFLGILGDSTDTHAALLDLVAKLEIADPLNLWLGRMPIPSDRTSLSTVWAMAPFTLPGRYASFSPIGKSDVPEPGPRRGALARDDGVTLWGQLVGGRYKYYVGAFGLTQPTLAPLYSARLAVSLLNPEPGFYASSSHYGRMNVLALGVQAQHRAQGSRPALDTQDASALPDDFDELGGDILFEIGNQSAGVLDLEAAFARLWGENESARYQYFVLASYLLPLEVGIGRFQPLFRLQHAEHGSAVLAADRTAVDAQLGYVIDGHRARVSAGYQYTRIGGQPENAFFIGVQLMSQER